jgi:hypothetical protein
MPSPHGAPAAGPSGDTTRGLGRLFVLIAAAEVVSILALYWFGRAFS